MIDKFCSIIFFFVHVLFFVLEDDTMPCVMVNSFISLMQTFFLYLKM